MNLCCNGGWVVDRRPLPEDVHDHDGELAPIRGCTNLRCGFCNQIVRSAGSLTLVDPRPDIDSKALHATPELASSPLVKPSLTTRLYTCACLTHLESSQHPLVDPDPSSAIQAATQWRCVGHPVVVLPHVFDGWEIAEDHLAQIVDRALGGELPPGAASVDRSRAHWLARLAVRLSGTPYVATLARMVAARLTADDVAVRARAIQFFVEVPSQRGEMSLAALLSDHAGAFIGVADPHAEIKGDKTLEHALWRLARTMMRSDSALRDVARGAIADPARMSRALLFALAEGDPGWFRDNAVALATAHPDHKPDVLDACKRVPDAQPVVAALRALPR